MGDLRYPAIMREVADELGLSAVFVNKVYMAYWRVVKEYIEALPLKEAMTEEDFAKLRPNVNIPSLGKLNVTLEKFQKTKRHLHWMEEFYKNRQENNKEEYVED